MRKILLLLLFTLSTFAGPGTFPQGDHVKNLKDKIEFKNSKTQLISNDSDDPSAVAKFGDSGSLYMRTNGELWQKQDAGTTVNWTQLFFTPLFTSGDKLIKSNGVDDIIDTGIDVIGTDSLGNIDRLEFDTAVANPTYGEGLLFYDNTAKALSYYNDDSDVTVNVGQESIVKVRNTTGLSIDDGTPVFVSGSTGQTPDISLANASFIETSITLGLWTSGTTASNGFGYVTTFGTVNGLDTSSWTEGTVLYLDIVDGQLIDTVPTAPSQVYILGIVTNSHASQGKIFVRPESLTRDDSLYKNIITNFSGDAKFNPNLNKFTSGDSAIFGDSGTISGTLASSIAPADLISGIRVWKYTQAAGSLDDWIGFPQVTVPEIVNTTSVRLSYSFKYKYDGLLGDIETKVRCVDDSSLLISTSNAALIDPTLYKVSGEVTVPKDCNEIIVGLQVVTLNNGAILLFDDIKVSDEPREIADFQVINSFKLEGNDGRGITALTEDIPFTGTGTGWTSGADNSPNFYTVQYENSLVTIDVGDQVTADTGQRVLLFKDGTFYKTLANQSSSTSNFSKGSYTSKEGEFAVGDQLSIRMNDSRTLVNDSNYHYLNIIETAKSSGTVHANAVSSEDSHIKIVGMNGRGSTATYHHRFDSVSETSGTAVTYSDSATLGGFVTINEAGLYDLAWSSAFNTGGKTAIVKNYTTNNATQDIPVTNLLCLSRTNAANAFDTLTCTVPLIVGDILYFRGDQNSDAAADQSDRAMVHVSKAGIKIDNLIIENPNGEFTTQEIILGSDVSSDGVISALTFSNLEVGEEYLLAGQFMTQIISDNLLIIEFDNGSTRVHSIYENSSGGGGVSVRTSNPATKFTATATTLTVTLDQAGANGYLLGNATKNIEGSYIQLTKLPKAQGFVTGQFQKVLTGYIKTKLTDYSSDLIGTTAWKTHPLLELEADASSFASISANQLTLKAGKYNFEVPIGAFNGSQWVDFNLKNITNVSDTLFQTMAYSDTSTTSFRDAEFSIDITVDTVYEFQTRSAVAAGSEFLGKIKIQQVLAR